MAKRKDLNGGLKEVTYNGKAYKVRYFTADPANGIPRVVVEGDHPELMVFSAMGDEIPVAKLAEASGITVVGPAY